MLHTPCTVLQVDSLCAGPLCTSPLIMGMLVPQYHKTVDWALRKGLCAVISGMDVAKKIEAVGSGSGKPSKPVVIVDSGELTHFASDF